MYAVQQQLSYMDNTADFVRLLRKAQESSELQKVRATQAIKRVKENRMLENNM